MHVGQPSGRTVGGTQGGSTGSGGIQEAQQPACLWPPRPKTERLPPPSCIPKLSNGCLSKAVLGFLVQAPSPAGISPPAHLQRRVDLVGRADQDHLPQPAYPVRSHHGPYHPNVVGEQQPFPSGSQGDYQLEGLFGRHVGVDTQSSTLDYKACLSQLWSGHYAGEMEVPR